MACSQNVKIYLFVLSSDSLVILKIKVIRAGMDKAKLNSSNSAKFERFCWRWCPRNHQPEVLCSVWIGQSSTQSQWGFACANLERTVEDTLQGDWSQPTNESPCSIQPMTADHTLQRPSPSWHSQLHSHSGSGDECCCFFQTLSAATQSGRQWGCSSTYSPSSDKNGASPLRSLQGGLILIYSPCQNLFSRHHALEDALAAFKNYRQLLPTVRKPAQISEERQLRTKNILALED